MRGPKSKITHKWIDQPTGSSRVEFSLEDRTRRGVTLSQTQAGEPIPKEILEQVDSHQYKATKEPDQFPCSLLLRRQGEFVAGVLYQDVTSLRLANPDNQIPENTPVFVSMLCPNGVGVFLLRAIIDAFSERHVLVWCAVNNEDHCYDLSYYAKRMLSENAGYEYLQLSPTVRSYCHSTGLWPYTVDPWDIKIGGDPNFPTSSLAVFLHEELGIPLDKTETAFRQRTGFDKECQFDEMHLESPIHQGFFLFSAGSTRERVLRYAAIEGTHDKLAKDLDRIEREIQDCY